MTHSMLVCIVLKMLKFEAVSLTQFFNFQHVIHSAENDILLSKFGHLGAGVEIEMLYLVQAKHKNDPGMCRI